MPIDPALAPFLGQPGPSVKYLEDPVALREQVEAVAEASVDAAVEAAPPVAGFDDVEIPVEGGTIRARIIRPLDAGPRPVHLFFHGGAFTVMSAYTRIWMSVAQDRAARSGNIVVTVDYRKSPEHKFPTALNDVYSSLEWVAENIHRFGGNPERISVGGHSAGGNLAAALSLKARNEGGPKILLQVLEVPALDLRDTDYDSRRLYSEGYMLHLDEYKMAQVSYLPNPEVANNPYASPLLEPDLSGLPSALLMVAQYDVLSDDGVLYAQRLKEANVPVRLSFQLGHTHSSSVLTNITPAARAWRDEVVAALKEFAQ